MRLAAVLRAATLAIIALMLPTGCAAPTSYLGVSLAPGAADPAVQTLAARAQRGDKQAQLDLGIRYEEGNGVPADPKRARKLYRAAAATTGGTIYVYVPATKKGGRGYTMPVNMGPRVEGLKEAARRLTTIEDGIYRRQFETVFTTDIMGAFCDPSPAVTLADWQRSSHFIVEGKLSYKFIDPSGYSDNERPGSSSSYRAGDHYEAEIEIVRFIKWPDKFPKPKKLEFKGYVDDSRWTDVEAGKHGGCLTWGPRGELNNENAILVLRYTKLPAAAAKFDIVQTIRE